MIPEYSFFRRVLLQTLILPIVIFLLFGALEVQSLDRFDSLGSPNSTDVTAESSDSETSATDDNDLERCQRYCLGGPGGSNVLSGQVASCIQDCNDSFWKAYDKRMQDSK